MRRLASEVIRELEMRVARLERERLASIAPFVPKDMFRDIARSFPSLPRGQAYSKNGATKISVSDIGLHSAEIHIAGPTFGVAQKIMKKIGKLFAKKYGFEMTEYDTLELKDVSGYRYKITMNSHGFFQSGNNDDIRLF